MLKSWEISVKCFYQKYWSGDFEQCDKVVYSIFTEFNKSYQLKHHPSRGQKKMMHCFFHLAVRGQPAQPTTVLQQPRFESQRFLDFSKIIAAEVNQQHSLVLCSVA